ncbi:MAG TPA: hypothetical protein VGM90_00215 [Kofleriaceae bacterium]|jgi:hypothetical protein
MRRLALLVGVLAVPSLAFPCDNAVSRETSENIKLLTDTERMIAKEDLVSAAKLLKKVHKNEDSRTEAKRQDLTNIVTMRQHGELDVAAVVVFFQKRVKQESQNWQYKALLGEALFEAGKTDDAKKVLLEVHGKDVMPDAHGYLALAKMSNGDERAEFLKACAKRTKSKTLCVLDGDTAAK